MQYGLIERNLTTSPLVKLFKKVQLETFYIRQEMSRWPLCAKKMATYEFQLARSIFLTKRYLMYCLIISTSENKVILRQVGSFTRQENARLALNRGTLHCSAYKLQRQREPNTHMACPIHLTDTCHLKLNKNIESARETQNGTYREYFIVHEGKLEFASTPWWHSTK